MGGKKFWLDKLTQTITCSWQPILKAEATPDGQIHLQWNHAGMVAAGFSRAVLEPVAKAATAQVAVDWCG